MPLFERDYYTWRGWVDRSIKRLLKGVKGVTDNYLTDTEKIKLDNFPATATATLTIAEWVANSQTVNVAGVTADSKLLISSPSTNTEYLAYVAAQVRATTQGAGNITFICTTTPTIELITNILILG